MAVPHFLWKATSATPGLGGSEIGAAGVATTGGGLPRRCAGAGNMAIEHREKALGIGRIAGFDDDIEDQSAFAGRQVELVSVLNLTTAFDDDVGVRLEQADQLLTGRHDLTVRYAALGLDNNARYQWQVMRDLGTLALGSDLDRLRHDDIRDSRCTLLIGSSTPYRGDDYGLDRSCLPLVDTSL